MKIFKYVFATLLVIFILVGLAKPVWAFCGFYVGKADASLYNQASQVAIVRNGDRTVLTMANDYQGNAKDFALVVPVPVVLKKEQVKVNEAQIITRLDAFSSPRLVEYFDNNPCDIRFYNETAPVMPSTANTPNKKREREGNLGVTVEAKFSVGEYDILILSAKESNGLETWLKQNGYKLPQGASELLSPYIRQQMKFFVAKVNLKEFDKQGFTSLRPLSIAYESRKFMLPIRLGTVNAKSEQDLIVYLLSPQGRTEVSNYRTVNIPSNFNIPEYVQKDFGKFYQAMFAKSYTRENKKVAFLEYAWDMGSCDPCSAEPLSQEELKKLGVFWLDSGKSIFLSRIHVRYTRQDFPEDLRFQNTSNSEFFQGRYVLNHPYTGEMNCDAGKEYKKNLRSRQEQEAQNLARYTGWNVNDIRQKMNLVQIEQDARPWWEKLWSMLF
jgi:hypothetical protein